MKRKNFPPLNKPDGNEYKFQLTKTYFFVYFSNNKMSSPPTSLQFKMVRKARDDFISSFLTLMSIFPRAYFLSSLPRSFLADFISQVSKLSV